MKQKNEEVQPSAEIEYGEPFKMVKVDYYDISTNASGNEKKFKSFKTVLLLLVSIVILVAVILVLKFVLDDAPSSPTFAPTDPSSTTFPTFSMTSSPSIYPTSQPTNATSFPTSYPSFSPTPSPTSMPTSTPTDSPTISPTPAPTSLAEFLCEDVVFGGNNFVKSCLSSTSLLACISNGNGAITTCGNCACPVDVFVVVEDIFDICVTTSCEEVPQ
eukprot:snap_masked-scaffold_14-processed-gene-0.29-mRNA-1 protein AED:1.00 eAED:1.00 QI:0/-1/0/0/-1/1/1/0/215